MMIAVPSMAWRPYQDLDSKDFSCAFLEIAALVDPSKLRKHSRGPKKTVKKGYAPGKVARSHVSTARILNSGKPAR